MADFFQAWFGSCTCWVTDVCHFWVIQFKMADWAAFLFYGLVRVESFLGMFLEPIWFSVGTTTSCTGLPMHVKLLLDLINWF